MTLRGSIIYQTAHLKLAKQPIIQMKLLQEKIRVEDVGVEQWYTDTGYDMRQVALRQHHRN